MFDVCVLTFVVGLVVGSMEGCKVGPAVGDFEGKNEGALESANVGEGLGFPSAQIAVTSIFKYNCSAPLLQSFTMSAATQKKLLFINF